jgi:hypothetical protein
MSSLAWLCGIAIALAAFTAAGHFIWLAVAGFFRSVFGIPDGHARPARPFRYCPACGEDSAPADSACSYCQLDFDSRLAYDLHRLRVAVREVRALRGRAHADLAAADEVAEELEARARALRGLPAKRPRARPVAPAPVAPSSEAVRTDSEAAAPADAVEVLPARKTETAPDSAVAEPAGASGSPSPLSPALAASLSTATPEPPPPSTPGAQPEPGHPAPCEPPPPPRRGLASFLETHNILWGELVGGLLIVGCSIALVVTLRQTLESIPYFQFLLSAAVTLALFGAGQYTLHRWKLSGTSRAILVISMLLTPLTLLLLSDRFAHGAGGALDLAVKLAAVAAFVGVVRTGGRDLIGTDHLPGPIDRRWLLSLAVVGAAGTQLLPVSISNAWLPLLCFVAATGATLGGLSWYHPGRREEPVGDRSGTALLMFVGLAIFSLLAAWGLFIVRDRMEAAGRLHSLALPFALAGVPVVEAGVLVLRRTTAPGLRTMGTAVALLGFVGMTAGLALAWPEPLPLLLVSAAAGLFLTRVAFRERLPWVQAGAIPLLALAIVLSFHGLTGGWRVAEGASAGDWLGAKIGSSESGAVLAGFAVALGLAAELLARRLSRQTASYAFGALSVGAAGLLLASWHGVQFPATAAFAHAACAIGLLASNARWKRRAIAQAGLWVALAGSMWALWWLAPGRYDMWGFVVAAEAFALSLGAVALRGTRAKALAVLRRAARDVAFAACVLAGALAVFSRTLESAWHTGTLITLALAGIALARLTGAMAFTVAGAVFALLGFIHLAVYTADAKPETLAVETALLTHATLAALAAVARRRQARVFGNPFQLAAVVSSLLAVPILFFPPPELAHVLAILAVWLGVLWLAFMLFWRERGWFFAFQAAITLAGLLVAFRWIEQQPWYHTTAMFLLDPRALHAFGLALGVLAIAWVVARRIFRPITLVREVFSDNPLSLDRFALAGAVVAFPVLHAFALVPGVRAELTPLGHTSLVAAPGELAHAFEPAAWWLLALLTAAVLLSWRLSKLERDADPHAVGAALLLLAAPTVWAGTHAVDVAAASAARWGLAVAFVVGSAAVALRAPLRRFVEAAGFPSQTSPWLRLSLLAISGVAAGVVVLLSAAVAEIGLSRLKPSGPDERSLFALMGVTASNIVPLALVVFGLGLTAGRERSSGYALAGGLVFVATLTAFYTLAVVTAGKPLDGAEQTRLMLVMASAAAVWALVWLAVEWRVPGGIPLAIQVSLALGALGVLCAVPAMRLIAFPGTPLPAAFDPLGQYGWAALALVSAAGFWHLRRSWAEGVPLAFAYAGIVAGVLAAAAIRGWDVTDWWLSFRAMALAWAAAGFAFFALPRRGVVASASLIVLSSLLVLCAARGGWADPWRPWLPAGLSLCVALFFGGVAVRMRLAGLAVVSGLAIVLAAVFAWLARGPDTTAAFALASAAGCAAATTVWTLIHIRQQAGGDESRWLDNVGIAACVSVGLLAFGLVPTLAEPRTPTLLPWGAAVAVAVACAAGLWDRSSTVARPTLYATGVLAALLGVVEADPLPVWNSPLATLALAAFVLAVAAFALGVSRSTKPLLRIPERDGGWPWLLAAQSLVAAGAILLGLRTELIAPGIRERLATPAGVAFLASAFVLMARTLPETLRDALRTTAAALAVLSLAALAWAVPSPSDNFAWLHRNAWLFVALAFAAVAGSAGAPRLGEGWNRAVRSVAGWAAVAAYVVLCVNLVQQVPVYNPDLKVRRTPLAREAAFAMLAGIAGLIALALRFALKPERDPFELRPARRTAYVYLAEVLVVLFFAQIRFNVPEAFRGDWAKLWTFAVMALAYVGIGLAELFERKKTEVLAVPLRRTGVLLPLVPLLAFWAKPPALVSEFARDRAPGLGPFLGYLEKLPQHFDTYSWLWFLAGGVYALLALSRKSFGWALLAALATNAALWSLLTHHEVPFAVHPQAWVIPLALIVLASEHINRRRLTEEASNAMRYAGIAMIYVASAADMFLAGVGNSTWLPVILAVLCVAGVLAGILLRVRAFIYLGVGFLLLDLFSMIWYAAVDLQQTWVWYASGIVLGVVVLALFAYLEKQRTHERREVE